MDQRTESIKREVDETRESMTAKMEQIESQVQGKVDDIKGSAQETVERIKTSTQETIDTVKEKVDIKRLVDERPWTMFGASIAAGFVLGTMLDETGRSGQRYRHDRPGRTYQYDYDEEAYYYARPRRATPGQEYRYYEEHPRGERPSGAYGPDEDDRSQVPPPYRARQHRPEPGFMSSFREQFGGEIDAFRDAAIATATSTLHDLMRQNLPRFAEEFDRARSERERQHREGTARHATNQSREHTGEATHSHQANPLAQQSSTRPGSEVSSGVGAHPETHRS